MTTSAPRRRRHEQGIAAATAGRSVQTWVYAAQSDGTTQAGDPAKAAKAIADAVASGAPSLRLPLGADAVTSIRQKLARVAADVDRTEPIATATSY